MTDPRSSRRLAAGCFLAYVSLGLSVAALGPTLPFLAERTGSTLRVISYLFVGNSTGYMAGTFFGGSLFDRFRGNRLMVIALLAMVPPLAVIPLLRSFVPLLLVYLTLGFFQGTLDSGGNLLVLWTPEQGRGVRMNALHLFFGLGAMLSPLILGQARSWTGGIAWGYWCLALLCLPPALWFARLPAPRRPPLRAAGDGGAAFPVFPVALVAGFVFLAVALEAGFGNWIFTWSTARGVADAAGGFRLTSVFWAAFTGGRLLFTLLAARLRPRDLLLIGLVGAVAGISVFLLWPAGAGVWIGTAAFGLFTAPLVANSFTLAGEIVPITGRITGIFTSALSLGGLFLPWLIGQLFERLGPSVMPVSILLVGAAALPICLRLRGVASRD